MAAAKSFDLVAQGMGIGPGTGIYSMQPQVKSISDAVKGLPHTTTRMRAWEWEAGERDWIPTSTHTNVHSNLTEVKWWQSFNRCAAQASHPILIDTNSMKKIKGVPTVRVHCEYDSPQEASAVSLRVPMSSVSLVNLTGRPKETSS